MRSILLPLRLGVLLVASGLLDAFITSGPRGIDWDLERLRMIADRVPRTFAYTVPAQWDSGEVHGMPVLGFNRIREEFDALGYDCVEAHRGIERELFDAGLSNSYCLDDETREVIVGRFQRREGRT
jgi:hypothetical protein